MHEALKEAKIKNKNLEKTTELGNHKVGNSGGLLALMVLFTAAAGSYLAYRHCKGVSRFGTKAAGMVSESLLMALSIGIGQPSGIFKYQPKASIGLQQKG